QCHKADFQQVNRLLKRQTKLGKDRSSISANQEPEVQSSKFEVQNRAKHTNIRPKHSALGTFFLVGN
ncbi:hypothetical protein, partial [Vibrio parahaemolyticus]|uniref:hypothetical protein n=1 Tax=Vibrio parahaemolyticus TaxID=670 RepID=UPI00235E001C